MIMSKVLSVLRKNAKTIFISAVILAFVVIFAIMNTESALEIVKLLGVSTLFTLGAFGVALVLSIPSIIIKVLKKRAIRFGTAARVLIVLLFIALILGTYFIIDAIPNYKGTPDKEGVYPSMHTLEYKISLPQAFVEDAYPMTFGIFSIILCGLILAFAGNLMILSWENHDSVKAKICKIGTGVLFAVLLHWVVVFMDYVSTMLSLDYFTTVGIASIIGMYIGYGVYGKIQDRKDRKLRAKGL